MKVTDRWLTGYLRAQGFQTTQTDYDAQTKKLYWVFDESPQLRTYTAQYFRGATVSVLLLKDAMANIWEEIEEWKTRRVAE